MGQISGSIVQIEIYKRHIWKECYLGDPSQIYQIGNWNNQDGGHNFSRWPPLLPYRLIVNDKCIYLVVDFSDMNVNEVWGLHWLVSSIISSCVSLMSDHPKLGIISIWVTVKLGDTLAFLVKPCCSCRTNSTTSFIFSHVTTLHTILNGHALLTTMGGMHFWQQWVCKLFFYGG